MARIFTEGFEMGDTLSVSTNSYATIATTPRSGNYNIKCGSSGMSATGIFDISIPSKNEIYVRSGVNYIYSSIAGIAFRKESTELISLRKRLTSDYFYMDLYINNSLIAEGQIPITSRTWSLFEIHVKIDDSSGAVDTKVNVISDINYSGDTNPGAGETIDTVRLYGSGATGSYQYFDDIAINDTTGTEDNSWCGDGHILRIAPNANGDNSDFKGNDGDYTDNYLLVDDRPSDGDTTFVVGENVNDYDLYNFAASGLPTEQIIKRVWVEGTAKDPEAGNVSMLVKSGTTLSEDSADQSLGSSYGRIKSDEYTTNPDTGAEWSEAELDAIQAGMKVKS